MSLICICGACISARLSLAAANEWENPTGIDAGIDARAAIQKGLDAPVR